MIRTILLTSMLLGALSACGAVEIAAIQTSRIVAGKSAPAPEPEATEDETGATTGISAFGPSGKAEALAAQQAALDKVMPKSDVTHPSDIEAGDVIAIAFANPDPNEDPPFTVVVTVVDEVKLSGYLVIEGAEGQVVTLVYNTDKNLYFPVGRGDGRVIDKRPSKEGVAVRLTAPLRVKRY